MARTLTSFKKAELVKAAEKALAKVERAFIDGEEEGFATIYTRLRTGRAVHCYPTQAEVFQRLALEYVKLRKNAEH
jgi:hypothetical protein